MNRPTAPVFLEAVLLGVALLNGGNRTVQVSTSIHVCTLLLCIMVSQQFVYVMKYE